MASILIPGYEALIAQPAVALAGAALTGTVTAAADTATRRTSANDYAQLGAEAVLAAAHFGNTTQSPNLDAQYVITSPTGTDPGGWLNPSTGYCGYHATIKSAYGKLAWTNLPHVPDPVQTGAERRSRPLVSSTGKSLRRPTSRRSR